MLYRIDYTISIPVNIEPVLYLEYKIDRKMREERKRKVRKNRQKKSSKWLCFKIV